ncbi:hypothetical protein C3733_00460 [Bacillus amyloliquefaciens]|nr:hypothetical protein C3733_00460 [Bacillus amyloliquefaciens]
MKSVRLMSVSLAVSKAGGQGHTQSAGGPQPSGRESRQFALIPSRWQRWQQNRIGAERFTTCEWYSQQAKRSYRKRKSADRCPHPRPIVAPPANNYNASPVSGERPEPEQNAILETMRRILFY